MANPNISASITPAQKTTIKNNLAAITAILNFLVNLTPKQRQKLFKMGNKSVGYAQLALQIAQNNPGILPASFNTTEFAKDVALSNDLVEIESVLTPLAEGTSDTLMAVGNETMKQANQVYALVKVAAKADSNMSNLAKQLGERYKAQGNRKPKTPTA